MKIILFANTDWYLYNFRLSLIKELLGKGLDVVLVSPPGHFVSRLRATGCRWVALPMDRRSINPGSEALVVKHLVKIYKTERPDLVHHFTLKCVIYGTLAAKIAKVPAIINAVAGLGYVFTNDGLKAKLLRPLLKSMFNICLKHRPGRLILQNSDDHKFFLKNKLVNESQVRIIHSSGVNVSDYMNDSSRHEQRHRPLRVLMAARLLWDKGIQEYHDAACILKEKYPAVEFLLAGAGDTGNPTSIPDSVVSAWKRSGIITPLGYVDDMAELLNEIDIFVLPSYREGIPMSLLEAAASGLPLVATDVPGCREVVSDNVNGLLVPKQDHRSLATAIQRLLDDQHLRREMGASALRNVMERFDERIVIDKTIGVYRELICV